MNTNYLRAPAGIAKREHGESPHQYRSEFDRDRDRILYSTAFRRLSGKTQVFLAGYDAHVRTRLTHTLEVVQIAATIALKVKLDTTLCQAIALGHDIGHSPFGHIGEEVLNQIMNNCEIITKYGFKLDDNLKGFKHNLQSLRVVNQLERYQKNYSGLNLTYFTQ